ncbi:MAG: glycosyltransferase [Chloroflexi bacterium]|nr:glycosyltransferase [Chloroflexota bacterium]
MSIPCPSVSILITASREPDSLGPALEAFLLAPPESLLETLVICPDVDTAAAAARHAGRGVRVLRDSGRGKPAALNLGLGAARGELVVLSDGDVRADPANWPALLAPFADPGVGATTGQPLSLSPRQTMLGYWSHLLTAIAHGQRQAQDARGDFLLCSGYLYAFRRALVDEIPEDALAEDAVVSVRVHQQGHRIRYTPEAKVYVKYPTTYADWVRQKRRSLAGYAQGYVRLAHPPAPALPWRAGAGLPRRSFRSEARSGALRALRFARTPKELLWTGLLFAVRVHVWLAAHLTARVLRRPLAEVWQRVEATK